MITWTVGLTARPGGERSFIALANELTETSNRLDEGCVVYICLQEQANPREFLWYEQWATMPLLEKHVERIRPMLSGSTEGTEGSRLYQVIERREQLGYHVIQDADPEPRDWQAAGLTQVATMRVRAGKEDAFRDEVADLSRVANAEPGCLTYIFHQREDDPQLFVVLEQWRDAEAFAEHGTVLRERFGAPRDGERLPAGLADYLETLEVVPYDVVAI